MAHYRTAFRDAARAALAADPHFAGVEVLKIWPGSIDDAILPVLGVLTPQEPSQRDSQKSVTRRTLMQVALRRKGGDDIEDQLDEDSARIEAVILATLRSSDVRAVLEDTTVVSHSQSQAYVGTLIMSFRLQTWQPEPTIN